MQLVPRVYDFVIENKYLVIHLACRLLLNLQECFLVFFLLSFAINIMQNNSSIFLIDVEYVYLALSISTLLQGP